MSILDQITDPADLKSLSLDELDELAGQIRDFLIEQVTKTGGHLGPNLGVVELTIALHKVFDSPKDPIIFDTGHQCYVHKILTGRSQGFDLLRQEGGLSGYPSRAESEHDWVENSHASSGLGWAEGLARGFRIRGEQRTVAVVVGDGALTGGMSWEALNNIAVDDGLKLVIVINDNGRSYSPTVGGLARRLTSIRTNPHYEQTLEKIKWRVSNTPLIGKKVYDLLHGFKTGVKDAINPDDGLYADLGIKYVGPVDGHDLAGLIRVLQLAKDYDGPVIVHAITQKGHGYEVAEKNIDDQLHAINAMDPITGSPTSKPKGATWTEIFAEAILAEAKNRPNLVGITAAMAKPVGLDKFAKAFPQRVFDVGIAEQQAVASAAGLARSGCHPVFAVYSTFLNRAFDQVLMDVGLHKLPVTFVLDRAGVTGSDGPSHNGMWDVPMLSMVPGLRLASPRDAKRLRSTLHEALNINDGPTVIRYSKEAVPEDMDAVDQLSGIDFLVKHENPRGLIIGYGQFAKLALETSKQLFRLGIPVDVVDPIWALPVSADLVSLSASYKQVASLEDNLVQGAIGWHLSNLLAAGESDTRVSCFGLPKEFLAHGSRKSILAALGLTSTQIAKRLSEDWAN